MIGMLAICAALSLGSYLTASEYVHRTGYHARNFGENFVWEFTPGQPSAGSTAPAWTLLLAIGYSMSLNGFIWTFFLGWLVLWSLAVSAWIGFKILVPDHKHLGILAGLLLIFEWHLTWAAGSGMETLLAGLIAIVAIIWVIFIGNQIRRDKKSFDWQWLGLGLLIGLGIWVRPDLITLTAVAALAILLENLDLRIKVRSGLILAAGFLMASLPYILFNLVIAGEIWPNTFYAKQAEYAVLRSFPIWQRFLNIVGQPLTGVGIVLLPGFLWFGIRSYRNRSWAQTSAFIWVFVYLFVYSLRLPVSYQHGRYVMPIIPVVCLFGLVGIVTFSFWLLGIGAYARDVAVIESEMVEMARWVANNTDEESLLAAHDIGALGYFAERNLLDLAGLVSPEVIPFIRDEKALQRHISEMGANYLVTFPGWYPELTANVDLIYQTDGQFSPQIGGENMSLFEWQQ
jgi:hypothetical protein